MLHYAFVHANEMFAILRMLFVVCSLAQCLRLAFVLQASHNKVNSGQLQPNTVHHRFAASGLFAGTRSICNLASAFGRLLARSRRKAPNAFAVFGFSAHLVIPASARILFIGGTRTLQSTIIDNYIRFGILWCDLCVCAIQCSPHSE